MPLSKEQREQLVSSLVTNCDCWKNSKDAEILNNLTDEGLTALKASADKSKATELVANAAVHGFADESGTHYRYNPETSEWEFKLAANKSMKPVKPGCEPEPDEDDMKANAKKPLTMQDWLKDMPAEAKPIWNNLVASENRQREELIAKLIGNAADEQKAALQTVYGKLSTEELRTIAATQPVVNQEPDILMPNYAGAGVQVSRMQALDDSDILPLPVYNWAANNK